MGKEARDRPDVVGLQVVLQLVRLEDEKLIGDGRDLLQRAARVGEDGEREHDVVVLAVDRGIRRVALMKRDARDVVVGVHEVRDLDEIRIVFEAIHEARAELAHGAAEFSEIRSDVEDLAARKINLREKLHPRRAKTLRAGLAELQRLIVVPGDDPILAGLGGIVGVDRVEDELFELLLGGGCRHGRRVRKLRPRIPP